MADTPHRPDPSEPDATPPVTPDGSSGHQNVLDRAIDRELHDSYLTYAMSTIMDRALPDVRDGLKPSQRRILVAMHDLGLTPGAKHRKCAKIAGDTSGNYHPHGESVIYPTLVHMGQGWKQRVTLVDKQGNFGSIDGDPPAAMRYTEARMTAATVEMLADIKLETVDYRTNYDDTRTEPVVLPARFPNLLINGSSGIAVGMACSMPPHNVGEICDAIVAILDDPDLDLKALIDLVPGPDFPTGGIIQGRSGIHAAYASGRGRILLRGRVEQVQEKGRDALVISEIPFQLVQSNLIERMVDAAKSGRIPDIADIKNFSGKTHRTRIVVYLKKGSDPDVVEKQLYQFTPLQSTYSIINIALWNGRPRTLGLRSLIDAWIEHRREVIRRRTEHLLREASKQAHRLEGLIYAVCDIDEVIRLIRASRTREEAIERLMERRFQIPADHPHAPIVPQRLRERSQEDGGALLSRVQAEAIGALRLIQLVGLEIEKLVGDYADLLSKIEEYEGILGNPAQVTAIIRAETVDIRAKFATPRLTQIDDTEYEDFNLGDLTPEHTVAVTISHAGYVKRLPVDTYRAQGRGGMGIKGSESREGDFVEQVLVASTHDDLLAFTNSGRVFLKKVYQIPEMSRTSRGRAIVNLLELREGERVVAFRNVHDFENSQDNLIFATAQGRVKRTTLSEYRNVNRTGIIAIRLNEGDRLVGVVETGGEDHVLLSTASGMAIRFDESDARLMGRAAAGVKGIDLREGDEVVGIVCVDDTADLLTVTANGFGKRTPMQEYLVQSEAGARPQSRGGKGRLDIKTTERNGGVVSIRCVRETDGVVFVSATGMIVRVNAADISRVGRNTLGVRLVRLKDDDRVISTALIEEDDEEEASETGDAGATGLEAPAGS